MSTVVAMTYGDLPNFAKEEMGKWANEWGPSWRADQRLDSLMERLNWDSGVDWGNQEQRAQWVQIRSLLLDADDVLMKADVETDLEKRQGLVDSAEKIMDEAEKKLNEIKPKPPASNTSEPGSKPSATPSPQVSGQPSPDNPASESCFGLKQWIAECEQSGWKTGPCFVWLMRFLGCDVTITDPPPDGDWCRDTEITAEQIHEAMSIACGDPVKRYVEGASCSGKVQEGVIAVEVIVHACQTDACPTERPDTGAPGGGPGAGPFEPQFLLCPQFPTGSPGLGCFPYQGH